MMKKFSIYLLFAITAFCFISCEEPDEPVMPYQSTMPKVIGKSIDFIDILWDKTTVKDFLSYEVYYRPYSEPELKHYISIPNKWEVYTSITGLQPNTGYIIYVITIDKDSNKYISKELSLKTFSDVPTTITRFEIYEIRYDYFNNSAFITFNWDEYQDIYAVPFYWYTLHMIPRESDYNGDPDFICDYSNLVVSIKEQKQTSAYITINNYISDKNYYFKLRTVNAFNKYGESKVITLIPSRDN